ncbi:efflux transporter periplasmic adaptor subunit [Chlorobaculum limnaeum]|uniref:Efflux transporter periplasmic adaptor subunit n=1 Tax=Chlorobaculum limnaeum TaxID=274537 RepID=A0A1D8CX67_CHLLM|nr:HlyD family secretion protein [Chlorobaculum limnaeum]AOS82691.1 efflux transporter periplasmic adaptor subunit [Chlorobaculum limnaeum]
MAETQQSNTESQPKGAGKPQKERSWIRMAIFGVLLGVGVVWGGMRLIRSFSYVETDNAQITGNIYPVIPRVPGKVVEVLAEDNQTVKKGDILVRIDTSDYQIRRDMAEAQLLRARAAVSAAQAEIVAAGATQRKLGADLRRSRNLQQQDVISRAELDAATAGATASSAQHAAAGDNYKAALAQAKLAEAELKNAELQLSWATITAPADGKISKKSVQPGQQVAPGQQLIAIVGSGDLWVVANFKETQLEHMRPGQKVIVRVDAFPGKEIDGHVDSISAGTGAQFTLLPPDNASGNFVKVTQRVPVKIVFDKKPELPLAAGMNVIVEVKVK